MQQVALSAAHRRLGVVYRQLQALTGAAPKSLRGAMLAVDAPIQVDAAVGALSKKRQVRMTGANRSQKEHAWRQRLRQKSRQRVVAPFRHSLI